MDVESSPPVNVVPDDLKVIKGVGPVIERKLNDAGVYTFEQLGNLTASGLRRILGNTIERLSDEESLLRQARDLARQK
jgi:predicted flap endonuclease-1-like 5' DNA nuclease